MFPITLSFLFWTCFVYIRRNKIKQVANEH